MALDKAVFVFLQYFFRRFLEGSFLYDVIFVYFVRAGIEQGHIHIIFRFPVFPENAAGRLGTRFIRESGMGVFGLLGCLGGRKSSHVFLVLT